MRRVPIGDLQLGKEEREAVIGVLDSGRITEGKSVRTFEEAFAQYVGVKGCVAVSSGTGALITALTALKIDERFPYVKSRANVVTSPLTYIATVNAIIASGMKPIFLDIEPGTFTVSPRFQWDTHCAVFLPVHLMGYPCDMEEIDRFTRRAGSVVLEDASQAHGTIINGRKVGGLSTLGVFSFYVAHNIQAGEMGAIVSNDLDLLSLCRRIKAQGRLCDCVVCTRSQGKCPYIGKGVDPRFTHSIIGYNFKANEFSAAIALVQLKKANWIMRRRQENVSYLNQELVSYSEVFQLPKTSKNISHLGYLLVIEDDKINREVLMSKLESKGVECRPLFGCIPTQQPAYNYLKEKYKGKLPNAEYLGSRGFYIGCHQYLTQDDLDYVIRTFEEVLG